MKKKAQALMISLWILVTLTILAISIGHRVSIALRLSKYQRDKLKTLYLAKAGVNRAIVEIMNDPQDYDSLQDNWAKDFEKISFGENKDEFATVEVIDEERKININKARSVNKPSALIVTLLNKTGVNESDIIANNICAWKGDKASGINIPDYRTLGLGYDNKGGPFINNEELILVKDVDQGTYNKIKNLITVYGNGKVNINTCSREILEVLIEYCVKELERENNPERDPGDLIKEIFELREQNIFFESVSDLKQKLSDLLNSSGPRSVFNKLEQEMIIDSKSSCFSIVSRGIIKENNFTSTVFCVFERDSKNQIIYWHER